jgi:hypothetical protein
MLPCLSAAPLEVYLHIFFFVVILSPLPRAVTVRVPSSRSYNAVEKAWDILK